MILPLIWMMGCGASDTAPATGSAAGVLVYAGNVDGDIEPCG